MASHDRVFNVTRGCYMNRKATLQGFECCTIGWVEEGVSVRNLTYAETVVARIEQARLREPLEYVELPGIVYQPTETGKAAYEASGALIWEAHKFAREAVA